MKKITITSIFLFSLFYVATAQNIITVDNTAGTNAQFNDLQSAISAAEVGDLIYVHPSETNYGNINIDKAIKLIGFAHSDPDKKTLINEINLLDNASDIQISGFHIISDINAQNTGAAITNITIENNLIDGTIWSNFNNGGINGMVLRGNIMFRIGSNSSVWLNYSNTLITNNIIKSFLYVNFHESVTIKNNIFLNGSYPVNVGNDTGNLEVQNCIFHESSGATVDANSDGVMYQNCLSYNTGSGSYSTLEGSNNLNNQNPLFVQVNNNTIFESTEDDYNLQNTSPAIGAGINGENLGLFDQGNFVFNNFGFTNGIPTVRINAISTSIAPGQNLNVIISTSNN